MLTVLTASVSSPLTLTKLHSCEMKGQDTERSEEVLLSIELVYSILDVTCSDVIQFYGIREISSGILINFIVNIRLKKKIF